VATRPQDLGHGQPGEEMPAGPTTRDDGVHRM
jgi:hypothetical protein